MKAKRSWGYIGNVSPLDTKRSHSKLESGFVRSPRDVVKELPVQQQR